MYMKHPGEVKSEAERRLMAVRASEERVGCDGRWVQHFFLGDQNTLELDRVMVVQLVNMLLKKTHLII